YGPTDPRLWGPWPLGGFDRPWQGDGTIQPPSQVLLAANTVAGSALPLPRSVAVLAVPARRLRAPTRQLQPMSRRAYRGAGSHSGRSGAYHAPSGVTPSGQAHRPPCSSLIERRLFRSGRATEHAVHHVERSIRLRSARIRLDCVASIDNSIVLKKQRIGSQVPVIQKMQAS